MTQTERVLSMLRVAGRNGIRSDEFFACGMPRGAARIRDLKDEGVDIESVREGKYTRYRLVGVGAGSTREQDAAGFDPSPASPDARAHSSESVASEAVGSLEGSALATTQPSVKAPGVTPRSLFTGSRSKSGIRDGQRNSEPEPPKESSDRGKIDAPPRSVPSCFDADIPWDDDEPDSWWGSAA